MFQKKYYIKSISSLKELNKQVNDLWMENIIKAPDFFLNI